MTAMKFATKSATKPLSDTQLAILAHAAARDDLSVLPTPTSLKARGGALQAVLGSLTDRGLIEEVEVAELPQWRRDEEGRRLALRVTAAGLTALGLDDDGDSIAAAGATAPIDGPESTAPEPTTAAPGSNGDAEPTAATASANDATDPVDATGAAGDRAEPQPSSGKDLRPGTTGATVLALLRRETGASVPEMMEASGWQAHSVRGFMSGTVKKKLGLEVMSARDEGGERRYRVG